MGAPRKPTRVSKAPTVVTGEELARMPDIGRSELVRGRIVCADPTCPEHGRIEVNFASELRAFVRPRKLGRVLVGEVGIYTGRSPDTVRGADVLFISTERLERCADPIRGFLDVAPDLVVEVLSPGDAPAEVEEKLREYLACGVRLVWVADPSTRSVRAYRSPSDVRVLGGDDELTGDPVLPGFSVPVARLFGD